MEMQDAQGPAAGFRHAINVRYGECDMQGVVFNANYLAYVDDVCDRWMAAALGREWNARFDAMVKKATLEWHSAASHGDTLDFALVVSRWGNSSFEVRVEAHVLGRRIVTVDVVYISVAPGTQAPTPVPVHIREALARAAG
jgi:acyl-CoA thioester hydrolase